MDEFARIRSWTARRQSEQWLSERGVVVGIGDDAAVVHPTGGLGYSAAPMRQALTVDTMVEGIHFNKSTMSMNDVGYKALAASVSDIIAMGGFPLHALISVSAPKSYDEDQLLRLYDGLYVCADRYSVAIIGGDTTSSPQHLVISVTVTGAVEEGRELRRSGAMPKDAIFITGMAGMAAAGLHALSSGGQASVEQGSNRLDVIAKRCGMELAAIEAIALAQRRPQPSVAAGRILLESGMCNSLNDVSDGLASEAWEIAEASGLKLVLEERLLPRSGSMTKYAGAVGIDPLEWMMSGGEDYCLLGTTAAADAQSLKAVFSAKGLPFFVVGYTEAGAPGVELVHYTGERSALTKRGYNHFG